jgi:hypothetical protein
MTFRETGPQCPTPSTKKAFFFPIPHRKSQPGFTRLRNENFTCRVVTAPPAESRQNNGRFPVAPEFTPEETQSPSPK